MKLALLLSLAALSGCAPHASSIERAALVDSIRITLQPVIAAGAQDGSSLHIGMDALYAPLNPSQRAFLDEVQALAKSPTPPPANDVNWRSLDAQVVQGPEGETTLPVQLLPLPVWRAYDAMSRAMKAEVGKRLLVGSGYRSAAYQLFVFVSYLPVALYAFDETLRHVSLPSEHSQPAKQGLDFVNEAGIDLYYSDTQRFEELPEYTWLLEHAARFGFAQSVPDGSTAYSPWHWHYEPNLAARD